MGCVGSWGVVLFIVAGGVLFVCEYVCVVISRP